MRLQLKSLVAVFALIFATGPMARAVDFLYVTNGGQTGSFVSKYDQLGNYYGQTATTLNSPAGIAQDSAGNFLVVNNGSATMSVFNSSMSYVSSINIGIVSPGALTVDRFNNFYVSGEYNKVQKFDSAYNPVATFTLPQVSTGQGMVIDPQDRMYIASYGTNTIEVYNSATGAWISQISGNGISGPHGITRDGNGYLYVTNASNNTISKFNPDGTANSVLNGGGVLSFPIGIGFDSAGDFFVANNGNNTVTKYDASGNLLLTIPNTNLSGARWLSFQPYFVPEPSTYALAAIATGAMAAVARRRKAQKV